jgi:hypothetical protein
MITRSNLSLPWRRFLPRSPEDAHEVAANGAAQAPVVHLDDLLFLVLHEDLVVHAGLAELVLDHGDLLAVLLGQDAVQERGLPGPRKPVRMVTGMRSFVGCCGAAMGVSNAGEP